MTVYKNLWAGYETYFIRMSNSGQYACGIGVINVNGDWRVKWNMKYYASDLRHDTEHFPIVARVDLSKMIVDSIKALRNTGEKRNDGTE